MIMPEMSNFSGRTREIQEQFDRLKDELSRSVPNFSVRDMFTACSIIGDMYPNVGYCPDQKTEANARFLDFGRDRRLRKLAESYPRLDREAVEQIEPLFVIAAKGKVNSSIMTWTFEIERLRRMSDLPALA